MVRNIVLRVVSGYGGNLKGMETSCVVGWVENEGFVRGARIGIRERKGFLKASNG